MDFVAIAAWVGAGGTIVTNIFVFAFAYGKIVAKVENLCAHCKRTHDELNKDMRSQTDRFDDHLRDHARTGFENAHTIEH